MARLTKIAKKLAKKTDELSFEPPVDFCYNPLVYAWSPFSNYLEKYGNSDKEVLLLGMNPGPFGMAQTGVPFGDVEMVSQWMGIDGEVLTPKNTHPKRPIAGFDCPRGEVSGQRLWGWAKDRFKSPQKFFKRFFVWNYCPLCFIEESGRNRTPDKLTKVERNRLFEICDEALSEVIEELDPQFVIGVGTFARKRIEKVVSDESRTIGTILHPSPASPAANRGWQPQAEKGLEQLGISLN